ncbi:MAG: hypothetical protein WBF42_13580, partial [Terracidiphilus sp.]
PKEMVVGATPPGLLPLLAVFFEAIDRWRVRVTVVKVSDNLCHMDLSFLVNVSVANEFRNLL